MPSFTTIAVPNSMPSRLTSRCAAAAVEAFRRSDIRYVYNRRAMRSGPSLTFSRSHRSPWATWRLAVLFGLLRVAQLGSVLHGLDHAFEDAGQPPHVTCELCVAYAHLGDAVPAPTLPPLAVLPPFSFAISSDVQAPALRAARPYNVRAPPVLS